MRPFHALTGVTAPLPLADVDTDLIIAGRYVETGARIGLGVGLFHRLRYLPDGSPDPAFILNRPAYRHAKILVTGPNLGAGPSGKQAVWALDDFGIRCVISSLIADVFYTHCLNAGMLPVMLDQSLVDELLVEAAVPQTALMTVDLESQEIMRAGGQTIRFNVPPFVRDRLLRGADESELTLQNAAAISAFVAERRLALPRL